MAVSAQSAASAVRADTAVDTDVLRFVSPPHRACLLVGDEAFAERGESWLVEAASYAPQLLAVSNRAGLVFCAAPTGAWRGRPRGLPPRRPAASHQRARHGPTSRAQALWLRAS
jgi:hypothetical protein